MADPYGAGQSRPELNMGALKQAHYGPRSYSQTRAGGYGHAWIIKNVLRVNWWWQSFLVFSVTLHNSSKFSSSSTGAFAKSGIQYGQ